MRSRLCAAVQADRVEVRRRRRRGVAGARWAALAMAVAGVWRAGAEAGAAEMYWDVNGTAAGAGGPTAAGIWGGVNANWSIDPAGVAATTSWVGGSVAVFSAGNDATGTFNISVAGTQGAAGVRFEEGSVMLVGGTLSLSGSAPTIDVAGADAGILSAIAATGALVKAGAGTLVLSGGGSAAAISVGQGLVFQSGGTFVDSGDLMIAPAIGSTAGYTVTGGSISAANLYVGGTLAAGGAGTLQISTTGAAVVSGVLKVYDTAGSGVLLTGSGSLTAGSVDTSGNAALFNFAGGTLNLTGPGTTSIRDVGTAAGAAQLNQSGGTLSTDVLRIASVVGSTAGYSLSGGSVAITSNLYVGAFGAGSFSHTGGSVVSAGNNALVLGQNAGSSGVYTMGGAGATLTTTSPVQSQYTAVIGAAGTGTFNQLAGVHNAQRLLLGQSAGGTGTYNLSGGTLNITLTDSTLQPEVIGIGGVAVFNQTGGVHNVMTPGWGLVLGLGSAGAAGAYNLTAGDLNVSELVVGHNGSGVLTQQAGRVTVAKVGASNPFVYIGRSAGSSGTYVMHGGTLVTSDIRTDAGNGSFQMDGGAVTFTNGWMRLGISGGSVGNYSFTGGTVVGTTAGMTTSGRIQVGENGTGTFTVGGTAVVTNNSQNSNLHFGANASGVGHVNVSGQATLNVWDVRNDSGRGTFVQDGGTVNVGGWLRLGVNAGSTGSYTFSGGNSNMSLLANVGESGIGSLAISGGTMSVTQDLNVGYAAGGTGVVTMSGGVLNTVRASFIGATSTGSFAQSGGVYTVGTGNTGNLTIGSGANSRGNYTLSGTGSLSVANTLFLGSAAGAIGTMNHSAGTISIPTNGNAIAVGQASGGTGLYTLSGTGLVSVPQFYVGNTGTGTLTQSGGTLALSTALYLGGAVGGSGLYSMSGGSLSTPGLYVGGRSGAASGSGQMNISGTAAATVSGTMRVYNTANTGVTLSGGSLSVGTLELFNGFTWSGGTLAAGSVAVGAGGTFAGVGTLAAPVTLSSGSLLSPGVSSGGTGTLSFSNTVFNIGSQFELDLGTTSDLLRVTSGGGLTLNGGTINVNAGAGFGAGSYTLIDYAGAFAGSIGNLSLGRAPGGYRYQLFDNSDGTSVKLQVSNVASSAWNVDASGTWTTGTNWNSDVPDEADAQATFGAVTTAARTVTVPAPGVTVGTIVFGGGHAYTVSGPGMITLDSSAAAAVTASGGAAHVISAPVLFTGQTNITTTGASDSVEFAGVVSGPGPLTVLGAGTTIFSADSAYTGTLTVSAGTLALGNGGGSGSVAGSIVNNASVVFNRSGTFTFGGAMSGAGSVTKAGPGTMVLTGNNTYAGNTTVSAGTLRIGDGGTTGGIAGNLVINAAAVVDRLDDITYARNITGTGTLTKVGANILSLTGANTGFAGVMTVADGSVSALPGAMPLNVVNNASVRFRGGGGAGAGLTNYTYNGVISGTGATSFSTRTAVPNNYFINRPQTYTGATTVDRAVLTLASTTGTTPTDAVLGATSSITVGPIGTLILDNTTRNATDRLGDAVPITLAGGSLAVLANAAGSSETVGAITASPGALDQVLLFGTGALAAQSIQATPGAAVLFRAPFASLGFAPAGTITFSTPPSLVGGGAAGTPTAKVISYAAAGSHTGMGSDGSVATYDPAVGVRPLAAGEVAAVIPGGNGAGPFVNLAPTANQSISSSASVNSLVFSVPTGNATPRNVTVAPGATLTIQSGALFVGAASGATATSQTIGGGAVDFGAGGSADAVVFNYLHPVTMSSAVRAANLVKSGDGTLTLAGPVSLSGGAFVNQGVLEVLASGQLGSSLTIGLNPVNPATASTTQLAAGLAGGIVRLQNGVSYNIPLSLSGSGTNPVNATLRGQLDSVSGNNTWAGDITLHGQGVNGADWALNAVSVQTGSTLTLSGAIGSDPAPTYTGLAVAGNGTTVLTGGAPNTYRGLTRQWGGLIVVEKDAAFGTTNALGVDENLIQLGGTASTVAFRAPASSPAGFTYAAGEWIHTNGTGFGGMGQVDNLGGNNTFAGSIAFSGASSGGFLQASIGVSAGSLELTGQIASTTASAVNLTKLGTGSLILSGNNRAPISNTFDQALAAGSTLTINAGSVRMRSADPSAGNLPSGMNVVVQSAGTLIWDNSLAVNNSRVSAGATVNLAGGQLRYIGGGTLTNVLSGSGSLRKTGDGTLTVSAANTFTGGTTIDGGTVRMTSGNALSTGTVTINSGATLDVAGVTTSLFSTVNNDGSTLRGTGNSIRVGQSTFATSGNMAINVPAAADSLRLNSALRNAGAGGQASTATITVTGGGVLRLISGATGSLAEGTQYSGNWVLNMDNSTGVMALGPITTATFGEPLNALGYQAPATDFATGYNGLTRPITIKGGTLAVGADSPNTRNTPPITSSTFRSPIRLEGGRVASTASEYGPTGDPDSPTPVTAKLAADITLSAGTTSTVLLYDPLLGPGGGARSVSVVTDALATTPGVGAVSTNLTWEAGSTLVVDPGTSPGGVLNFQRTSGVVQVSPGAGLSILAGAMVSLAGTVDPLSDGTDGVAVSNAGTLAVGAQSYAVGSLAGPGALSIAAGGTLSVGLDNTSVVFSGAVSGTGNLVKIGMGALQLAGNNSAFTGAIKLQQGTLLASADANLGAAGATLHLLGGTFSPAASFGTSRTVVASNASIDTPAEVNLSLAGPLAATGTLTKSGAGRLTLAGTATGLTTVSVTDGTLAVGAVGALGNAQVVSLAPAAVLDTAGLSHSLNAITGSGTVLMNGGNVLTLGANNSSSSFAGVVAGDGSLTKAGNGVLTLSGANLYTGSTSVLAGTLRLASNGALPATTVVTVSGGAALDTAGTSSTVAGLSGAGIVSNSSATASTFVLSPAAGASGTFSGVMSGSMHLQKLGAGTQTLTGPLAFSGSLSVMAGTLELTADSSFAGPITLGESALQPGILSVASDTALGAAANGITLVGGRLRAAGTFASARSISVATPSSVEVVAGATFSYSGSLGGSAALTKLGGGTLQLTSAGGATSPLMIGGGSMRLGGSAGAIASTSVTLATGTSLVVDNGSAQNGNRLSDSADVVLRGGTFSYIGAANTASTELLGQLIPQFGGSTVSLANGASGTTTVTFSALGTRAQGATVNFQAAGIGTTNRILFTAAPPVVASDPVTGNLGSWATVNSTDWAKYSLSGGVIPFAPGDYSNDVLAPNTHVRLTASPAGPVGDLSIRTLNLAAASSAIDVTQAPGTTLTLTHGGLLKSGTHTATLGGGTLRSTSGTLNVYSTGGDLRLAGTIGELVAGTDLVKAGDGTLFLGGGAGDTVPNTYTGVTRIQGGTVILDKAAGTYAIPGGLEVSGGTLVVNRPGQINPNASVSLTGGTFDLNGRTETFTTFTNDGGTLLFNGGTLNLDGIELRGGTTIVASELAAGSYMIIAGGDNQIRAGGLVTVSGTTTFAGDASPGLTIFAGLTPGRLNLGGDLAFDGTAGTAVIASTAVGAGETPGTVDLRGASRTFSVNDGAAPVDLRVSARIQSGALVKSGAGLLRLEAANTYAGGTTLSEGTLEVAHPAGMGTGGVTFSSTAKLLLRSDAASVAFNNPITVSTPTRDVAIQIERATPGVAGTFTTAGMTLGRSLTVSGSTGGTLQVPAVALMGNLTVNNTVTVDLQGPVAGEFGVTKTQPGLLILGGAAANTYTGTTTVNGGVLQLQKTAGTTAIPANLTINGTAAVRLGAANQIADAAAITLNAASGFPVLDVANFAETVGSLNLVAGGSVNTGTSGLLTLLGDLTFTGAAGTGMVSGNVALGGAGARHVIVANGSAATDLEIAASLSGNQGLVKDGPGELLLSGVNSLTGGITITDGILRVTSDAALNANPVTLAGGTLLSSGALSVPISFSGAGSLDVSSSLTLAAGLSGAAAVTKTGTGTLTLAGNSTLTGPLNIAAGTLAVPSSAALGSPAAVNLSAGTTFRATSSLSSARPFSAVGGVAGLDVPSGQVLTLSGGLAGAGAIDKVGLGTVALAGPVSLSGLTTVAQGTLVLDSAQTFPGGLALAASTSLHVAAPSSTTGTFTAADNSTINHGASTFIVGGTGNTSLGGTLRVAGSSGGSVTFSRTGGTHTVSPGTSLQIDAGASVTLGGSASVFPGSTSAIQVSNAGTFSVAGGSNLIGGLTGAGSTSVTGGLLSTAVLRQSGLLITGGSVVVRPATTPNSPASTSLLTSLSITGGGALDLGNDSLVIDYAEVSPFASIRSYLFFGRNAGAWNGAGGINSAVAGSDPSLTMAFGYVEAADLLGLTGSQTATWNGVTVDATTLLVKFTYAGDANLNGRVEYDDFALLDRGRARGGSSWVAGDFNYDGAVTSSDYVLLDRSFAQQSGPLSPAYLAGREAQFGPAYVAQLVAAVPEPSLVAGLALCTPLLRSRRRQRK